MGDINRRYFEGLMADRKLSLRGLAAKIGMGHSQLSLTFSGARRMTLEEAATLSQLFGEPLARIVENAGVAVRPAAGKRVDVIGAMGGDGTVALTPAGKVERTTAPEGLPDDVQAVQFRTAGTPLEWLDSFVCFFRTPDGISPEAVGRLCVCQITGGPVVVAHVRRGYRERSYNLTGIYHQESALLDWASPILITRH